MLSCLLYTALWRQEDDPYVEGREMRLQAQRLVKTYIFSPWRQARYRDLGMKPLAMLVISNLVIVATGGLSLLWQLRQVHAIAKRTPSTSTSSQWLIVLGMHLRKGAITVDYALRLEKALALQAQDLRRRILVLGGRRGAQGQTEAEKGKEYLVNRGVSPSSILLEDKSSNTLDNLRQARAILGTMPPEQAALITNRYHLARAQSIAVSLGFSHTLCAAEERLCLHARALVRFPLEAYYLHWIMVGRAWNWLTGRENS